MKFPVKSFLQVPDSLLRELGNITPQELLVLSVFINQLNYLYKKHGAELAMVQELPMDIEELEGMDPTEIRFFFKMDYVRKRLPSVSRSNLYRTITSLEKKGYLLRVGKIEPSLEELARQGIEPGMGGNRGFKTMYEIKWVPGKEVKPMKKPVSQEEANRIVAEAMKKKPRKKVV